MVMDVVPLTMTHYRLFRQTQRPFVFSSLVISVFRSDMCASVCVCVHVLLADQKSIQQTRKISSTPKQIEK